MAKRDNSDLIGHVLPALDPTAVRLKLHDNGYRPIPVEGKAAKLPGWSQLDAMRRDIRQWAKKRPDEYNTGIVLGESLVAIDLDILDETVSHRLKRRAQQIGGDRLPLIRIGMAPKTLVLFRAAEPLKKMTTPEYFDPENGQTHQVEILADGQQIVASGIHPDTGEEYHWVGESPLDVEPDELPEIRRSQCEALLRHAEAVFRQHGWERLGGAKQDKQPKKSRESYFTRINSAALESLDKWVPEIFSKAKKESGTGAWRITSKVLRRTQEEDLSLHPDGVRDFGEEVPMSAIDVVVEWGKPATPLEAAKWLCDTIGFDPNGDIADDFDDDDDEGRTAPDWTSQLDRFGSGTLRSTLHNVQLILVNDRRIAGLPERNHLSGDIVFRRSPELLEETGKCPLKQLDPAIWAVTDAVNGHPWSDTQDNAVRAVLEAPTRTGGYGIKVSDRDLTAALDLAAKKAAFHPIREYLDGLEWDGTRRVETLLIDYLGAPDNAYIREVSRLTLLAAVTRAYEPGHKFDFVTILEGLQGRRKSTFIAILARHWFVALEGDFGDRKKMVEIMLGKWIAELPELSALGRSEIREVKAFVSLHSDKVRLPYDRRASEFPRGCIFIGSTNDSEYLIDETGNRRFWPVACADQEIDTDRLKTEIDQVWAEARVLYLAMRAQQPKGTLPLFLRDELARSEAVRMQESRRVETAEDGLAGKVEFWLDTGQTDYGRDWHDEEIDEKQRDEVCLVEIWSDCLGNSLRDYNRQAARHVGGAMKRIKGWEAIGARQHAVYGKQRIYRRTGTATPSGHSDTEEPQTRRKRDRDPGFL